MSDGRRRPPIEVGDRLVVLWSAVEVTVTKLQTFHPDGDIVAVDDLGREWYLEGWQVKYK